MDESENNRSFLVHFPPDIWGYVARYLPVEQLGRLIMTGSMLLSHRLMAHGVVRSVKLKRDRVGLEALPSFLNGLPSLDSLAVSFKIWSPPASDTPQRLFIPSSVKKLKLSANFPSSGSAIYFVENCLDFPLGLESLKLSGFDHLNMIAPLFPPSLRKLTAVSLKQLIIFDFELLPRCLTSLRLSRMNVEKIDPQFFCLLPPTLTKFKTDIVIPCSAWPLLPPHLETLSFWSSWEITSVHSKRIVHPITGAVHDIRSCPFETLPRSITHLELVEFSGEVNLLGPPSSECPVYFPPQLKTLSLSEVQLSPKVAKLLPSTLAYLSLDNLCERICEHLPSGLTELVAFNTLMSPNLFQLLPKTLTRLHAVYAVAKVTWYDNDTGESFYVETHPEYSTHQSYGSSGTWNTGHCILPNLLTLELNEFPQLDDSFIQYHKLPSLRALTLRYSSLSDISIPLLSRNLTHLEPGSDKITGKSFVNLPRGLILLDLSTSSSVFDADIQHLPRTLRQLNLNSAIHLTNQCVPDFPPHLKSLRLNERTKITVPVLHFKRHQIFGRF